MALEEHVQRLPRPDDTAYDTEGEDFSRSESSHADYKGSARAVPATAQSADDYEDMPGAVRSVEGVTPDEGAHLRKKRKGARGDEFCDWHKTYLREKQKSLKLRGEALELRGVLVDKDATIARLKLKHNADKTEHHREQARLQENQDRVTAAHIESTKKLKDEILRLKLNDNAARADVNARDLQILELKQQLDHLCLAYTRAAPKQHEQTLVPVPDRKVRAHPEYKHPEAPRENETFLHFKSPVAHPPGEGKILMTKYGSTKYWDLGLCRVHFEYGRPCSFAQCKLRHEPLTANEQIYMGLLEPEGPKFLKLVAVNNITRRHEVLL